MNKILNMVWAVATASLLTACVPSTGIQQPLSARPAAPAASASGNNGAIYQAGVNERPMFEDRRARNVGDVLIINIVETTSATGKGGRTEDNSGSIALTTPVVTGVNGSTVQGSFGAAGSSSVKSASKSDSSGSNTFSGAITVTVTEVLANGNLRVAGEKQVAIRYAQEYVRFSGTVNPSTISSSNTVQSTQVADVQVEYKGATNLDTASVTTMFNRIFMSVLPF
ncbi:MAG: flagellar basal body L-ring protein FlgH [Gallionellaceae bacterium]|nr:flagellar basal body L-ring protein FlgH [Gallionellaceae bacterium]